MRSNISELHGDKCLSDKQAKWQERRALMRSKIVDEEWPYENHQHSGHTTLVVFNITSLHGTKVRNAPPEAIRERVHRTCIRYPHFIARLRFWHQRQWRFAQIGIDIKVSRNNGHVYHAHIHCRVYRLVHFRGLILGVLE